MFKVLIPAVAVLGAIAFAAHTQSPTVETQANVQPMSWTLHHEGAIAKLAYGVENSDQLALMLTCSPGDRGAVVYGDVQPASPAIVRASMGPAEVDPFSGGEAFETRISLRDPVLIGLAERGRMRVEGQAGGAEIAATADERRTVGEFLAYCGAERA